MSCFFEEGLKSCKSFFIEQGNFFKRFPGIGSLLKPLFGRILRIRVAYTLICSTGMLIKEYRIFTYMVHIFFERLTQLSPHHRNHCKEPLIDLFQILYLSYLGCFP